MTWTDERVELCKKLWAEQCSASVIAGELGGITRNAVVGKLHRLGLKRPARAARIMVEREKRTKRSIMRQRAPQFIEPEAEPLPPTPLLDTEIPIKQRRTLFQLTSKTCRWPVGDPQSPDFFFCGAKPVTGRPYCARHCAIGHNR